MTAVGLLTGSPVLQAGSAKGSSLRAETEHFQLFSRQKSKMDLRELERFLSHAEDLLGESLVGRVEYHEYGSAQEVAGATGRYAGGVAYAAVRLRGQADGVAYPQHHQIHAIAAVSHHEVVHILAHQLGDPGPFFQEGLAVALGDEGQWRGRSVHDVARGLIRQATLSALMARFNPTEPQEGYAVAGSFVGWLIERHGAQTVAEFFRTCNRADVPLAFRKAFGESLDAAGLVWADALSSGGSLAGVEKRTSVSRSTRLAAAIPEHVDNERYAQ